MQMRDKFSRYCLITFFEGFIKGRPIVSLLNEYQNNMGLSTDQVLNLQWQKLKDLLDHCYHQVPFYRNQWDGLKIHPNDINSLEDYAELPVLTKTLITENYDQLISCQHRGKNIKKTTGGSTGVPFSFEHCQESYDRRQAVMWRGYGECGVRLGRKTLYLWGADVGEVGKLRKMKNRLYHALYNRKMLNSFVMSEHNMMDYVKAINNYKPPCVVSYVSPLMMLAEYIDSHNLKVYFPEVILTGAEPLYDFQRDFLTKVFGCRVYNTYGCREFMLLAYESPQDNKLHWCADHVLLEVIDDKGQSIMESEGDLLVTDLHNYGMPFLRYQNGDRATLVTDSHSSHALPVMESIDGRKLDIIFGPNGSKLPGEFFPHMLKELSNIKRFQVIQKEVSKILIKIVPSSDFGEEDRRFIQREVDRVCGAGMLIEFSLVDSIPLTRSGKYRVTISELSN